MKNTISLIIPVLQRLSVWLLATVLFAYHHATFAQVNLMQGKDMPNDGKQGDLFWNTENQEIWIVRNDDWMLLRNDRCTNAVACHSFVLIELNHERYELLDSTGVRAEPYTPIKEGFHCFEGIMTIQTNWGILFYDPLGGTIARIAFADCPSPQIDTIGEHTAFCVPEYIHTKYNGSLACSELNNWGMLGTNGKWLIEPKFDEPFHFENGTAEVVYYGQRRKINEKGDFVE